MKKTSNNTIIFAFMVGLVIGVFAGGGIIWNRLKSADPGAKQVSLRNKLAKPAKEKQPVKAEPVNDAQAKKTTSGQKTTPANNGSSEPETPDQPLFSDSGAFEPVADSLSMADTTEIIHPDSLLTEGTDINPEDSLRENDEEIIVKKEELVHALKVKVIRLGKPEKAGEYDSLLTSVSGIRENKPTVFVVEFWESPINYKGYKMANNKLVLFGLKKTDDIALFELDNVIYLKHFGNLYDLDNTFAFRHYNKVKDEQLILKFQR